MNNQGNLSTRLRILETAERLFAEHGFKATSLRNITRDAAVNLAAVHYHFGSKEGLLRDLIRARIEPVNAERLKMLETLRKETGEIPPALEKVFEAFYVPMFRLSRPLGEGSTVFIRMFGRIISELPGLMDEVFREHFRHIVVAFTGAIREALPELPEEELYWRFHLALSAMLASIDQGQRLRNISGGLCDPEDMAGTISRTIEFVCAGFQAPVGEHGKEGKK